MQQILAKMGLSHLPASKMVDMFFSDQMPQLVESIDTRLGVSGSIFLPFFADHLSKLGQKTLVRHIVKGISLAKDLGARVVSLAGLLPSYTGYGFSVLEQLSMPLDMSRQDKLDRESAPLLTTGHGSTVVAMAKTILGLLDRLELSPSNLQIGVIGFGSIGRSTMELLLNLSLNPASITIFEREQQVKYIEKGLGTFKSLYSGPIEIIPVQDRLPDRVNQCDLLIGASSSGQILAVDQLKPSMLLVDDSFPSIVNLDMAKNRVAKQQDLIISGGGMLDVGDFKREFFMGNLPGKSNLEKILDSNLAPYLKGVAGCRMESLLIADDMELSCIHGLVDGQVALNYWKKISILGIEASPLHIGDYQISSETVERVKETVNHGVTYV